MKKIFRMFIFSAFAIYLTSLWNKGFIIEADWQIFLKATLLIALIYYLIVPITKIILLPINFLTLGLVSIVAYFLIFYIFMTRYDLIQIKAWTFPGISLIGLSIGKTNISLLLNIILSSLSISTIINLSEKLT